MSRLAAVDGHHDVGSPLRGRGLRPRGVRPGCEDGLVRLARESLLGLFRAEGRFRLDRARRRCVQHRGLSGDGESTPRGRGPCAVEGDRSLSPGLCHRQGPRHEVVGGHGPGHDHGEGHPHGLGRRRGPVPRRLRARGLRPDDRKVADIRAVCLAARGGEAPGLPSCVLRTFHGWRHCGYGSGEASRAGGSVGGRLRCLHHRHTWSSNLAMHLREIELGGRRVHGCQRR
mmetsp:Transcript_105101/g.264787  ORF Transcript_105101/g.264787 Transcript_105101/m.264787 type:complete len:229 (+) Transcript_105101:220-906(+)